MYKKIFIVLLSTLSIACGKKGLIHDAHMSSTVVDGNLFAKLSASFETSGLPVPTVSKPLYNNRYSQSIGTISIGDSGGKGGIDILVNLSLIAKLSDLNNSATLPNGHSLPISGIDTSKVFQMSPSQSNIKVYVYLDQTLKQRMIGFAVPVKQLDRASNYLPDLFKPFSNKTVNGTGGLYFGSAGQSGIAMLFKF